MDQKPSIRMVSLLDQKPSIFMVRLLDQKPSIYMVSLLDQKPSIYMVSLLDQKPSIFMSNNCDHDQDHLQPHHTQLPAASRTAKPHASRTAVPQSRQTHTISVGPTGQRHSQKEVSAITGINNNILRLRRLSVVNAYCPASHNAVLSVLHLLHSHRFLSSLNSFLPGNFTTVMIDRASLSGFSSLSLSLCLCVCLSLSFFLCRLPPFFPEAILAAL